MKVKFIYSYLGARMVEAGEVLQVEYLTDTHAQFDSSLKMPLNLFFKITHIADTTKGNARKVKRSAAASYPANLDEEFEKVWVAKGRKGAKPKAKEKFKAMLANESEEVCTELSAVLVADIQSQMGEIGFPELHLTTYLNQERWER